MAEVTPLKAVRTGGTVTALAEMQAGDTIPASMLPSMNYEASGAAAAAVTAHEAADDPHPQYAKESALGTAAALNVAASGDAAVGEVVKGNDTRLTDARPASDVSAWAKAATKPIYTAAEVGAAETSHTHTVADVTGLQDALDSSGTGGAAALYRAAVAASTAITATHNAHIVDASGDITLTFSACATLASGWYAYLCNAGTGRVTLTPYGSELVDGLSSYIMYPGEVRLFQCDGYTLRSLVLRAFYTEFATSGTFTVPPGYTMFEGLLWGGGGGGSNPGTYSRAGGGGGACHTLRVRAAELGATVPVTIGAGGAKGGAGGTSSFAGRYAYGGGGGKSAPNSSELGSGGGGGGVLSPGGTASAANTVAPGGDGGTAGSGQYAAGTAGGLGFYGGGGGAGAASGGASIYGGGGGCYTNYGYLGGASTYGGAGGGYGTTAQVPGGGGAYDAVGAAGMLKLWGVV